MQTREQAFGAGQSVPQNGAGTFFRLLKTVAPVNVFFYRNGAEVARAEDMEAGFSESMPEGFDAFRITSATAQTVKWATRQGGEIRYDRIIGDVSIINAAGAFTNAQKTVTNASAQHLAANAARRYLLIQNKDATGSVYISFGAAATVANGVRIPPGGNYEMNGYAPTNAVHMLGDIASNANVLTVEG